MTDYLYVLVLAPWLLLAARHLVDVLHLFQQHEYDGRRFVAWGVSNWRKVTWPIELAVVPFLLFLTAVPLSPEVHTNSNAGYALWGLTAVMGLYYASARPRKVIKPLVVTARARRLIGASLLVLLLSSALSLTLVSAGFPVLLWAPAELSQPRYLIWLSVLSVIGQLAMVNILVSNVLMYPVEASIRGYYLAQARRRLKDMSPIVVGITGSYGKTSTKTILAHILSSRYSVLATPQSFNTLMGICKVINTDLRSHHQYFVVEMGAYKLGDIASVCSLVKPKIGILTAVGPQHLERFKTIENVAKAKNELIEALPEDGVAIVNGDDAICARLAQAAKVRVRRYGLSSPGILALRGKNLEVNSGGSRFDACGADGDCVSVHTALLGQHNAANALGAMLAASECGVPFRVSAQALPSLPPLEHRLKPIAGPNGVTYIDDSYNSNPQGAATALAVLGSFTGRRILVTPGIVELGRVESEMNEEFGRLAAAVCHWVILVGNTMRTRHIARGLERAGFDGGMVTFIDSLEHARPQLREKVHAGDVILFENDLPDIY